MLRRVQNIWLTSVLLGLLWAYGRFTIAFAYWNLCSAVTVRHTGIHCSLGLVKSEAYKESLDGTVNGKHNGRLVTVAISS